MTFVGDRNIKMKIKEKTMATHLDRAEMYSDPCQSLEIEFTLTSHMITGKMEGLTDLSDSNIVLLMVAHSDISVGSFKSLHIIRS